MATQFSLRPRSSAASDVYKRQGSTLAQTPPTDTAMAPAATDAATLPAVTVTSRASPPLSIGGWGDIPLSRTPLPASIYEQDTLRDYGVQRLSDLTRLDPAINDAYNAVGYWDAINLRGFVLDNRFNYRRDGLPINAETAVPLDNKERVEVLKGISGMQAGTSAPGGLVNFVVKRPTDAPLRSVWLQWQSEASLLAAVDLSQRFGEENAFGLRLNAAGEQLRPNVDNADGHRALLALAGDWRLSRDSLLEAEFESSRQSQPSVPGFSLLGDRGVPPAQGAHINLNNQAWSQPVVFDANTASLRFTQTLNETWRWSAQLATQRLRTDDRIAFPYGCFDPNPPPDGRYYGDRYCPDGSFDLYDFRSENERRRTDTGELAVHARLTTGSVAHALSAGVLGTQFTSTFQRQAYNYVGNGSGDGSTQLPADPTLTDENTNRNERSTEFFLRDAVQIDERFTLWLAIRHTSLDRQSVRTDGSRATDYSQSFNTPWLAASYQLDAAQMLYASWGRGAESDVVPNRSKYVNAGEALPTLLSQQVEVGLKGERDNLTWSVAAFDITRPAYADVEQSCDADGNCTLRRQLDGDARHTGVEAGGSWRNGPWWLGGGLQYLKARRGGSQTAAINGQRPVNVPALTFKAQLRYSVATVPTLTLGADVAAEGDRTMLPDDGDLRIPSYAVVGLNGQWTQRTEHGKLLWRAGIDNLFDRQGWKEAPYQFGHVYLFPLPGRTARLSVQANW
jgi:iron complex outermembrane receptor protein